MRKTIREQQGVNLKINMSKTSGFGLGKWVVILGIAAAAGALGYYFFARNKLPALEFQTEPVTRGELTQTVTATGTLNPVPHWVQADAPAGPHC